MDSLKDMDGVQGASAIYSALVGTRLSDKYRAVELLDRHRDEIDLESPAHVSDQGDHRRLLRWQGVRARRLGDDSLNI